MLTHVLALAAVVAQTTPVPSPSPSATPGTLVVTPATVELNPAQQRILTVQGAVAPLSVTLDQKLVLTSVAPDAGNVTITATQATGNDVVHLTDGAGARADVPVRVAFNAGTITPQTTLQVTGNPVDAAWLARTAADWVARLTPAQPGAQTVVTPPAPPAGTLAPGDSTTLSLPVAISSGGDRYFPQSGTTVVAVQNVPAAAFVPALLFYDDDPEHVDADGVLFRGVVQPATPARLYYYHDNAGAARRIAVVLSSDAGASVRIVDSSAGPNADVMQVGHAVSRNALTIVPRGLGIVADLTPGIPFVLHDVPTTQRQGVAGAVDLQVRSGGPVTVTVLAVSPGVDLRTFLASGRLPGDGHNRGGTFDVSAFGRSALTFAAGDADVKLVIGDTDPTPPNADASAAGRDYGDYGVTHVVDLTLSDPGAAPATAYLYLRPIGGIARASFLVDGSVVELGCVRERIPYQIAAFSLVPGQTQHSTVTTMTDGGSFFPVEIGLSSTPPQPQAPPINAPDGCFPKP